MRDGELSTEPSECRVAILGDSFTFGFGVDGSDVYPSVLEDLLKGTGRSAEVLNFGVGGYSVHDELQVLRHKVRPLDANVVILAYFLNDPEDRPYQPLQAHFSDVSWWQYSCVLRLVVRQYHRLHIRAGGDGDYYRSLHNPGSRQWNRAKEALGAVAEEAARLNADSVFLLIPWIPASGWQDYRYHDVHNRVVAAARDAGFTEVLDLLPVLEAVAPRDLRVTPGDHHFSVDAHRIVAETLFARIADLCAASQLGRVESARRVRSPAQ